MLVSPRPFESLVGRSHPDFFDCLSHLFLKLDFEGIGEAVPHIPEPDQKREFDHLVRTKLLLQRRKPAQRRLSLSGHLFGKLQGDFLLLGE